MYLYWAIVAPLLPFLTIFLSAILIEEKKRVRLLFLGIICVFNIYVSFNIINTFRRDYTVDSSIFPFNSYIAYLIITNVVFLSLSILLLNKFESFKESPSITELQAYIHKFKRIIFKIKKKNDIMISILLIFCLFYIVGFINLFIHEFGHAIADILVGTYYSEIRINIYLQGWTAGGALPADTFFQLKRTVILLGGLITESTVAVLFLIIILKKKEKNNFTWLSSIIISMLFLNRVALYFTFPQLVNISSDTLSMVQIGYDPWILFFTFFPFLITTFVFTFKLISRFYKTSLKRNKRFIGIYFLSLTLYIVFLNILNLIDDFMIPLVSFSFI
ncbi:MAG: M50 family metallopeptidase [Candidatus Hermodarchaeota archaeon]